MTFAYRQFLVLAAAGTRAAGDSPRRPASAWQRAASPAFIVDFSGTDLGDARMAMELSAALSASVGTISGLRILPYAERNTCRVLFEHDPASEGLCEFRMQLQARQQAVSETWLYRWTAQ